MPIGKAKNIAAAQARFASSVPNFLSNAAESFGKEWETVCIRTKTITTKAIEDIVSDSWAGVMKAKTNKETSNSQKKPKH